MASRYRFLEEFIAGRFPAIWQDYHERVIGHAPHLSPKRAGELAATRIIRDYGDQLARLERAVKRGAPDDLSKLYERWVIAETETCPRELLIELSGTRTLLDDFHLVGDLPPVFCEGAT